MVKVRQDKGNEFYKVILYVMLSIMYSSKTWTKTAVDEREIWTSKMKI